ncbi:hypothetical protein [Nocardiopsis sp. CNT312]|uniref:hypothetical protein n=1 Tax=Nocardiopsis sp. CNT312 TaxID=1137268 RepID=UPI00049184D3|nr:hypothetical protein [Nocardiopsis sp. CNT312]
MILSILAAVAVLAAIAAIAAALLFAEPALVYVALALGAVSSLLLLGALVQAGVRGRRTDHRAPGTDGLGKASVPVTAVAGAEYAQPEHSGRAPAPAHPPVREATVPETAQVPPAAEHHGAGEPDFEVPRWEIPTAGAWHRPSEDEAEPLPATAHAPRSDPPEAPPETDSPTTPPPPFSYRLPSSPSRNEPDHLGAFTENVPSVTDESDGPDGPDEVTEPCTEATKAETGHGESSEDDAVPGVEEDHGPSGAAEAGPEEAATDTATAPPGGSRPEDTDVAGTGGGPVGETIVDAPEGSGYSEREVTDPAPAEVGTETGPRDGADAADSAVAYAALFDTDVRAPEESGEDTEAAVTAAVPTDADSGPADAPETVGAVAGRPDEGEPTEPEDAVGPR